MNSFAFDLCCLLISERFQSIHFISKFVFFSLMLNIRSYYAKKKKKEKIKAKIDKESRQTATALIIMIEEKVKTCF